MTNLIKQASLDLNKKLSSYDWFQAVGISSDGENDQLIVYVSKNTKSVRDTISKQYGGFAVKIEIIGKIKPLGYGNH